MLVKTPSKTKRAKPNRKVAPKEKQAGSPGKKSNGSSKSQGKKASTSKKDYLFLNIQPWKIILGVIVAGILGVLYLKHVFATQELLSEVEQLEQQYEQIKRKHDYYKLTYDRMIGPKEIYDKARAAGFIDGGPAEKVIEVKPVE